RPGASVDVQAHVEVARAVRVGGRAEAEALVQALRGRVGLVDVELHPAAAAGTCALERRGHERAPEPRAAGALVDEQVLEQAVAARTPDPQPQQKLGAR